VIEYLTSHRLKLISGCSVFKQRWDHLMQCNDKSSSVYLSGFDAAAFLLSRCRTTGPQSVPDLQT